MVQATRKYFIGPEPSRAQAGPSASDEAQANWQRGQELLQRQGPYTPGVVNQMTNRRADQTAAAEAVNAEEIRNQAAARGMDPTQAIRGLQQGRQAQNVAFSGEMASRAAEANFAAESPGRMAAAQAYLQRQLTGGTQPAVVNRTGSGGGFSGDTAFNSSAPSGGHVNPFAPRASYAVSGTGRTPAQAGMPAPQQQAQASTGVSPTSASNTIYDPSGGSGWVQNDRTGRRINIVGKPAPSAPTTAFSGAPVITHQQQQNIDAANVRAAPPINTKVNPFANLGQYQQGSRTLPMTNPFEAFR